MINYLIWILVVVLYAPLFKKLYEPLWEGLNEGFLSFLKAFGSPWGGISDYTHAYFILPVSLWLVWRKRSQLKELLHTQHAQPARSGFNLLGFFIFLLGMSIFILKSRYGGISLATFSLIPFLYGLIIYLYGINTAKALSFPIFYLLFMVPPPIAILDSITLPMRHWVSVFAESTLKFFDYPVSREGLLLSIGYHEIFIGPPCSGFRSLITMFALILIYIYISKETILKKIILASFIIPFALLGNFIRIITLCLITFYFGEEAGQGFFHNFSGIVIFLTTMLGVIGSESLLNKFFSQKMSEKQNV
jgi:exosortase